MKKIILAVMLLFGCLFTLEASARSESDDAAYRKVLREYMEVSGGMASYDVMMDMLFQSMPQITAEKQQEIRKKAIDRLVEHLAPVYKRHLTEADLRAGVAFFSETPEGQNIRKSQKPLMQEAMQVAHKFGMELQQMIMQSM